jgi:ERF superfamily
LLTPVSSKTKFKGRKFYMSQSELINELAAALSKAQGEMQAAIKDKINPFYKSSYADLGSVWDSARPVLSKYGLCVMQTTEINAEKNQIIMVTTLAHTSGQWMKSYLPLNPAKNDSQGVGAAITYLRRYSLSALVGVVCDDDDDGETSVGRGKTQQSAQNNNPPDTTKQQQQQQQLQQHHQPQDQQIEKLAKAEIIALITLIQNLDEESRKSFLDYIRKNFNASSIQEIPRVCYEKCVASINAKIKYLRDQEKIMAVA